MDPMVRYLACALIVSGWAGAAAAQQSPGDIYVAAGVSFPHQPAPVIQSAPPFPAPGGLTVGWLVGGGVFVSSKLSLEVEASRTGTMHASHTGRHDTSEVSTRRDWFLSFGVKAHVGDASGFRLEPIAGVVLVGDEGTYENGLGASSYRGYHPLDWVAGVLFGVDFRIGGRRLAFTPGLRFAFAGVPTGVDCLILRSGEAECRDDAERWKYGHPRWTYRPSVALRVDF